MQSQIHTDGRRAMLVCVDSSEKGVWTGRYYNSSLKKGESFRSLVDFLMKMEKTLDQMYFPQSFSAVRRFTQEEETELIGASNEECQTGKAATFLIRILFRQNASWQGSILWLEGKREESFRSVLELIFLMNDALNAQKSAEKK
ncbi:MAG: hypothetical protein ACI4LQ_03870 [Anaerovoracaceae bacterium]